MDGITDNNGVLSLDELTPDMIEQNLSTGKTPHGTYAKIILAHIENNVPYCIVNNDPWFVSNPIEQNSMVTSLDSNLKKLTAKATKIGRVFPDCRVVKMGDNTVLVNWALHLAKAAAEKAAALEAQNNDDSESSEQ